MKKNELITKFMQSLKKSGRFYSPHKATKEKFFGLFDIIAMDLEHYSSKIVLFAIAKDEEDLLKQEYDIDEFIEEFNYYNAYIVLKTENGWRLREIWYDGYSSCGGLVYEDYFYDENLNEVDHNEKKKR